MRHAVVYSVVLGVALFGGGGSSASSRTDERVQALGLTAPAPDLRLERVGAHRPSEWVQRLRGGARIPYR
jgi:hypothetical protein